MIELQGWKVVGLRRPPDENGRFAVGDIAVLNTFTGFTLAEALRQAANMVPPDCEYVAVMRG